MSPRRLTPRATRYGYLVATLLAATSALFIARRLALSHGAATATPVPICPAGPLFSVFPIRPGDLTAIVPLGHVVPPDHVFPTSHLNLYFAPPPSAPSATGHGPFDPRALPTLPVVAPGALRITRISRKEVGGVPRDYTLDFTVCQGVRGRFMLLTDLDPALVRRFSDGNLHCGDYPSGGVVLRYCSRDVLIDVAAGERLGTAGRAGGPLADGTMDPGVDLIDFGLRDERASPIRFARSHPDTSEEDLAFTVCPLDYYDAPLASSLAEKLGSADGQRRSTGAPRCGTVDQDRSGTAQGRWFKPGVSSPPEDPHLALIHDNVDRGDGVFSIGTSLRPALEPRKLRFTTAPSGPVNRDFAALAEVGAEVCYEHLRDDAGTIADVVIRLRLTAADRLTVTVVPSVQSCAAAARVPSDALTTTAFER